MTPNMERFTFSEGINHEMFLNFCILTFLVADAGSWTTAPSPQGRLVLFSFTTVGDVIGNYIQRFTPEIVCRQLMQLGPKDKSFKRLQRKISCTYSPRDIITTLTPDSILFK
jgi:hypothetical protein